MITEWLGYIFWPHPPHAAFFSVKVQIAFWICVAFVAVSVALRLWRNGIKNSVTKKLSKSWASTLQWYGLIGIVLVVARVVEAQYIAMRLWWIVWLVSLCVYVFVQVRMWRSRHYEIIPSKTVSDPRDPYLPSRKRRN